MITLYKIYKTITVFVSEGCYVRRGVEETTYQQYLSQPLPLIFLQIPDATTVIYMDCKTIYCWIFVTVSLNNRFSELSL